MMVGLSLRGTLEFVAPARVNLIGEHTDYTGGLVMPIAIPFQTVARLRATDDDLYRFSSETFAETLTLSATDRSTKRGMWSDYPVGVLRELQERDMELPGFQMHLSGNIPLGSGLSSSASVEVASALAMLAHAGRTMSGEEIALLCQVAENRYVGSPCGIMDQFAVANATAGHALLLNTRNLHAELLPMNQGNLGKCVVVVANSEVKHSIAGGDYGLRRRELEAGQAVLLARYPHLRDLGDASLEQLMTCRQAMTQESFRRCRHVITENARVREAADAMLAGDPTALGAVMTRAHASERDDFECSVAEVDFLVAQALELDGCFGARLTGGGFGGCTVNLVEATKAEAFSQVLAKAYRDAYAIDAPVYICEAVDGAMKLAAAGAGEQEAEA